MNKKNIIKELLNNRITTCPQDYKLSDSDIIKISNNIDKSIFNKNECSIWKGYITNNKNSRREYINYKINNKNKVLHRILYNNYVSELKKNEYIKFICNNKGKCCNINHLKKIKNKVKNNNNNNNNNFKNNSIVSFD